MKAEEFTELLIGLCVAAATNAEVSAYLGEGSADAARRHAMTTPEVRRRQVRTDGKAFVKWLLKKRGY